MLGDSQRPSAKGVPEGPPPRPLPCPCDGPHPQGTAARLARGPGMIAATQTNRGQRWVRKGSPKSTRRKVKASLPVPEEASLHTCGQPASEDGSGRGSGWYCRCIIDQQEEGFVLPKHGNACCRSRMHFVVKTGLDPVALGFSQQPAAFSLPRPLHSDGTA